MEPQFRFCTSADGTRIAYVVYGSGPSLLFARQFMAGMHALFSQHESRSALDKLASRARLVTFDRRGTGASARDVALSVEAEAADLAAVANREELTSFTLLAEGSAVAPSARYIVDNQERVARLVIWPSFPRDYLGQASEFRRACIGWPHVSRRTRVPPTCIRRGRQRHLTPEMASRFAETFGAVDLAEVLPQVATTTLVLQRQGQRASVALDGVRIASLLPNAELRLVTGTTIMPFADGDDPTITAIFDFMGVTGTSPVAAPARKASSTASILFADIVDSTALTERMGMRRSASRRARSIRHSATSSPAPAAQ